MSARKWLYVLLATNVLTALSLWLLIDRIGGLRYTWYRYKSNDLGSKLMRTAHLAELKPNTRGKRVVVMLGDSQVQNAEWNEMLGSDTLVVLNRGINTETIEGVTSRLTAVAALQPDILVIWVGINDLFYCKSAADVAKLYESMLRQLRQVLPQTPVFVCTLAPVQADVRHLPTDSRPVNEFNFKLAQLAPKYGCQLIDLTPKLANPDGNLRAEFTLDGVHLTHAAYHLIKQELEPRIGSALTHGIQ